MTRTCKLASCDQPVSGPRAEFCKPAHRAAFWRTQHVVAVVQEPGPRSGANARSGSQISYVKACDLLATYLRMCDLAPDRVKAERAAELILRGALSERQAERERARERS